MSWSDYSARDARLRILTCLEDESDYELNEHMIAAYIEMFGHRRSMEWLRNQLRWLEDQGAVKIRQPGGHWVAIMTRKGLDHVQGRLLIEGVLRPEPPGA